MFKMTKDKSEDERYELGQKILKLEQKENDFLHLKKKHEHRVEELYAEFRYFSFE